MSKRPRGFLIAGNWKMNHTRPETRAFFSEFQLGWQKLESLPGFQNQISQKQLLPLIFPPYLSIETSLELKLPVEIGAQNVHWESQGAFTGEISPAMLLDAGVKWALVGHSERRQYFGETDESVRNRAEGSLARGVRVILCVGETRVERESNNTHEVLIRQLSGAIHADGLSAYLDGSLVIAYEPVWAIGTGLNATPEQAEEAHQFIRKYLWDQFGIEASGRTPILYGGSVNPKNIDELLSRPNVDGALVGGASLKAESYLSLIESAYRQLSLK